MPVTGFTIDQIKAQLDSGWVWQVAAGAPPALSISYGFPLSRDWLPNTADEYASWSGFNAAQVSAARHAIGLWDDLIAATFTEKPGVAALDADIRFSNSTVPGYAYAYLPGISANDEDATEKLSGSLWLNPTYDDLKTPIVGDYGFMTLLHEIGHTIGLSHPGPYDGEGVTYAANAVYVEDTRQYTIMSYFESSLTGADWRGYYPQTPMLHDISTIQAIYGADKTTRTGDTVYGFNATAGDSVYDFTQTKNPILTIWDAGGRDTLDLSGWRTSSAISLVPGTFSSANGMKANIAIAYGADIERAIGGSAADSIVGNALDNDLFGLAGNDRLEGGSGGDWLVGGDGTDTLFGGDGDDWFLWDSVDRFDGGNGLDTLVFYDTLSKVGFGDWSIERAALKVNSAAGSAWTTTTRFFDTSWSATSEETNFADGSFQSVEWDAGNLYAWSTRTRLYDSAGVLVSETETPDGPAGIVQGGPTDITFSSNRVNENAAAGLVVGALGALGGAAGPFTWVLTDDAGGRFALSDNQIVVKNGALLDFESATTHTIGLKVIDANGVSYEESDAVFLNDIAGVTRSGTSRANTLSGTSEGDSLNGLGGNDTLNGFAGNDTLNGGTGSDRMAGGLGNDRYTVDSTGDQVTEVLGQGRDSVSAGISYTLGANVEDLLLTGTRSLTGRGNVLDNTITGNAASNQLFGGLGNDSLFGNGGNDTLNGDAGNDRLSGGLGTDTLRGGANSDTFVFAANAGRDTVTDFEVGIDKIGLEALSFGIDSFIFETDGLADNAAPTFLYDLGLGQLSFDADGSGARAAQQLALFPTKPVLDAADFLLI